MADLASQNEAPAGEPGGAARSPARRPASCSTRGRSWSTCAPTTSGRRGGSPAPPTCRWPSWPNGPARSTKDRPVVLYCRGGNRSSMAAAALAEAGYDAVKMSEGIVGWDEADLPLEPEDGYVAESGEAAAILQAQKKPSHS